VDVPALGKVDVSSGHELGQGVYLNEIIPGDSSAHYLASVTRYASNALSGSDVRDYSYAMSASAKPGSGDEQFALIERRSGNCFEQSSWVEVANVGNSPATATLTFYDQTAHNRGVGSAIIQPKAQFHFNGGIMIPEGDTGWVRIQTDTPGALVAQSAVYFHSCNSNTLETAYLLPAQRPCRRWSEHTTCFLNRPTGC
jgi:hypothetical protein